MQIRVFQASDEDAVVALWTACGLVRSWNDPRKDIARKLTEQSELFLVGVMGKEASGRTGDETNGELVASVMVGFDGHRGWLNYLAVSPQYQRRSFGLQLVTEAERLLVERGCPKLNIQIRSSNSAVLDFYHKLGYVQDEVVCVGKRLIIDRD